MRKFLVREAEVHDREVAPPEVWTVLGTAAIVEQLELSLAELEEDASEVQTAAEMAAGQGEIEVRSFERRSRRAGCCLGSTCHAHRLSGARCQQVLRRGEFAQDRRRRDR